MIGQRIATLRKAQGWTQEHLAVLVATHPNYIYLLETGRRRPGTSLVLKLARAFDVTTDALLTGDTLDTESAA